MKGIYFCENIKFDNKENIGIEKKVKSQIEHLKKFSSLTVINTNYKNTLFEKILFILPFVYSDREKQRNKLLYMVDAKTDFIYIRKPALTIKLYNILKKIKKTYPKILIMMEIPTYPFHSEYRGISKITCLKSIHCEKKLKKCIDYIITYSDDKTIWGIKTINLSNCVEYNTIDMRSSKYKTIKNTIRLTCVAMFTYWHGIDRLINGIKQYNGNYNIVLNVVGLGPEINNIKSIADGNKSIIFHGVKSGEELKKIFDETDIAVDALGRHRSGVYYNSSLKGKEYCARGIPIISSVKTELDFVDNYDFYLKLPANDEYINIEKIIDFYSKIYINTNYKDVSSTIRNSTISLFDYKYGFEERIKQIIMNRDDKNE